MILFLFEYFIRVISIHSVQSIYRQLVIFMDESFFCVFFCWFFICFCFYFWSYNHDEVVSVFLAEVFLSYESPHFVSDKLSSFNVEVRNTQFVNSVIFFFNYTNKQIKQHNMKNESHYDEQQDGEILVRVSFNSTLEPSKITSGHCEDLEYRIKDALLISIAEINLLTIEFVSS